MDPYEVLGVSSDCTNDELKNAYRKLMLRHHPDKAGPDAKVQCQRIIAAYHFILDNERIVDEQNGKQTWGSRLDSLVLYYLNLQKLEEGKTRFRHRLDALEDYFGTNIDALANLANAFEAAFPDADAAYTADDADKDNERQSDDERQSEESLGNKQDTGFCFKSKTKSSAHKFRDIVDGRFELLAEFHAELADLQKKLFRLYDLHRADSNRSWRDRE